MARPIANPPQKAPSIVPFSSIDQVTSDRLQPQRHAPVRDDPSRWSSSQLSELRPRGNPGDDKESVCSEAPRPESTLYHRQRANSFSTISEQQSVSGAGKRGELRIVIDRSEDRPKSAGEKTGNSALEVPIPHYRLGSPRFNTEGSAMLHSSVYTRTSMSDNFRNSTLLGGMADPLPTHLQSAYSRDSFSRNRPSFAVSLFSGTGAIDLSRASPIPRNSVVYELKGPVEPSIYEALVSDMDGQSVVRYIPGTKDISAATPARIVAQISSESFMDYELVSDFFLTFRSYLSPSHLLALLLARLQWAINRLQEDGRIIRIRTFAALRHWILNYFVDDFVANYDLRTHFCETINKLYTDVKSRETGGMSDLKILIDLKRCWNGKCSVYWTAAEFSRAYNDPDTPIAPGSMHIELSPVDVLHQNPPSEGSIPQSDTKSRDSLPVSIQHDRNDSAATAQSIPFSTKSEQSVLALSCSLPPKSLKRLSMPYSKGKAPHPVPLGLTKSTSPHEQSPSSPKLSRYPFHGHAHKRSGSFSDSVRDDRVPIYGESGSAGPAPQEILDPVSFIRGALYPPAESYMTMMAPDSPPLAPPSNSSNTDRRSIPDGGPKTGPSNSGVRTIIGSIKRALHTRNGGQSVSARIGNASDAISLPSRGKTSAMPNHIALGSEFYRERKMAAGPKRPARIDLLCDESLKQYRQVMGTHDVGKETTQQLATAPGLQNTLADAYVEPPHLPSLETPKADGSKIMSGLTTGSGSIVILHDTGFEFPVMSGAVPAVPDSHARSNSDSKVMSTMSNVKSQTSTPGEGEYLLPVYYNGNAPEVNVPPPVPSIPLGSLSHRRSFSTERQATPTKRMSLSLRLRKYASFQSGISKHRLSMNSDASKSNAGSIATQDLADKPMGPSLRRRPGGNLRQMQFVDEMEPGSGRDSFVSTGSYGESLMAETISSTADTIERPPSALIPPNPRFSLIQGGGGSNRNLRRSFEAAIAQFAQIPDDDDGGIESTLLKLEGKWRSPGDVQEISRHEESPHTGIERQAKPGWEVLSRRRQTDRSAYSTVGGRLAPPRPYSDSVADSEESYNSIPLLERGLTDESMKRPPTSRLHVADAYGAPLSLISSRDTSELASSHPSIQIIQKTESIQRIPRGSTVPELGSGSVGQNTPKRRSALSSEVSVDLIDSREVMDGRLSTDTRSLTASTVDIAPHPLAHPPSPPMTIQHPGSFGSSVSPLDKVLFQPQPLTPETSPRHRELDTANIRSRNVPQFSTDVLSNSEKNRPIQPTLNETGPDHVPFVLACESQMLAQQLTLVEMAALSEVDWRDLVEMRWSSASPAITSWVQFLSAEHRKGIDLVVGRFNLMVKWVVSEIVLTRDIHERARTIIKYIHTAAHARRLCNYATMLQIAIALSSSDCTRLQNTWQLVPMEDKRLFKDMECLIQPVRNFHDLRVEMETANLQEGCIPFIGLYVHDLTYNAQKPAQVSNFGGGLLVNFERYRTAARIVKSLLRLIDASTKYRFEPAQGIIERCLWIASLSEEEISVRSKRLE
ncbi:Guanine nucleotide exchange factor LTE1 [Penicillium subrubescens]|uniref:Guanine nucleotide exchange factor LTE1 n=1 Tax=Penicillium subrubescens TaxID=1316194 RepID=A0A1Q5TFI0_9EURO|nr:Guanine nucleotide exchange factor LTE1 [Penicillium subrubescens]